MTAWEMDMSYVGTNNNSNMSGHSPMAQQVKNLPAMQETREMQVQSLGREDTLEKEMAIHSSPLAWKISMD